MKILLTGGAGYIGSHTSVALSLMGHQVVLFDNLSNSTNAVLGKLERITGKSMPFIMGDVCDTDLLRNTLAFHRIDAVIHLAGLKAVGESNEVPINYYANNVQGAISLLQAMQAQGIRTLVFSSSANVYGVPEYLPIDENHPTRPTNPYGRSKLHVEEMLKDIALSDSNWRIVCLRYFNPIGAHESSLIGECPNGLPNNLFPYIAQVAIGQRTELCIFGDNYPTPDGTGIRDYIHVMDLADGHVNALEFLSKTTGWHAINLGTGQGYSVLEMVHAFEKVSGRNVPYKVITRRSGDIAECCANSKKASELLRWTAKRTLSDMCESSWRFQRSFVFGNT